ncbi:DNA polymerase epsilon, catalytic subunit, putative [Trichomonas vaginalis G3]|uniref:DNA polymerase epsilon, catalytic subunit, putative n=1 Tax=Trichomonas vaginalis (strain ATCC PRA-98 / G3) TaxID=412133 RepID=A2ERK8_TRIV3|nr:Heparinase II/III-like protein family [Trichomonas vaginalis G3]EAY04735.1 DNA polymerase epsilon, catalytic subunit, putative [Trichomonas vaginalis G3]KAI5526843.1 Heparinase II/III-like protein family [Trichomonas vaginalis G3]|eukprot:XP_001316958.1 DNA polymerase epsilon, catalytic subunit [Trichomonas vaginalis G3]
MEVNNTSEQPSNGKRIRLAVIISTITVIAICASLVILAIILHSIKNKSNNDNNSNQNNNNDNNSTNNDDNNNTSTNETNSTNYERVDTHPFILIEKDERNNILDAINKYPEMNYAWEYISYQAFRVLSLSPLVYNIVGSDLLGVSREALRRISYMSITYYLTKNQTLLERVEQELLNVCSFSDWHPSHFLDTAEMTTVVSIGLDWMFENLSESTINICRQAINEFFIK